MCNQLATQSQRAYTFLYFTVARNKKEVVESNFTVEKLDSMTSGMQSIRTISTSFTQGARESLLSGEHLHQLWKIRFIIVEKLSKRCCIRFRLLYKYVIGCCSFAETDPTATTLVCL